MSNQEFTRREFIFLTSTGILTTAVGSQVFGNGSGTVFPLLSDQLAEDFIHPPAEAKPRCYWYWMNGNITREGILSDLKEMARVGVGGVNYFDIGLLPAGPVVNRSHEWFDLVKFAVDEAAKLNIKVSVNCPGWSGSGGPWITPELSMQELTWSELTAEGGRELSTLLPQPPTRLGYYRDAAILAFPTPANEESLPVPQVVDIEWKAFVSCDFGLDSKGNFTGPSAFTGSRSAIS